MKFVFLRSFCTCTDRCESALQNPPRRHPLESIRTALIEILWNDVDDDGDDGHDHDDHDSNDAAAAADDDADDDDAFEALR